MKADYCFKSTAVFTAKTQKTIEGCVLISGEHILDVVPFGSEGSYIGKNTRIVDCGHKLVMPGFIDAHTHFFSGALTNSEHVCETIVKSTSEEECVQMMLIYAKSHPNEKRLRGRGWFVTNWGDAPLPTKRSLDRVFPDIPVYMQAADCHSYWLNSAALIECGITKETTVESGYIGRFDSGELDGMLVELEACSYADEMYRLFTADEKKEIYKSFLNKIAQNGITSMSEMIPDEYNEENHENYQIIKNIENEGALSVRLHIFPKLYDCTNYEQASALKEEFDSEWMRIAGLKGFIDGVVETYTGLLLEPYTDRPETCGIGVPVKSQEELNSCVTEANREGFPVRIHCIADGSVHMALDAFEASVKVNGKGLANTIEHIENIHPDDLKRFRKLGVLPSVQPIHLLLDANGKINRIGQERIRYEWPFQSLLHETGGLAIGTDYPVVDINPFDNIYAAVTRKFFDGSLAGFNPEQKLTMGQTLLGYTKHAAHAYSRQQDLGILEKGKLADLIVIDHNLFETPEEDIRSSKVIMTMSGGRIIYDRNHT